MDAMAGYGHFGPRTMIQRDEEEGVILFGDEQYERSRSFDGTGPIMRFPDDVSY
jgi:hypothetical protein